MKKFIVLCLVLPLFFVRISSVFAQHDIVTVRPETNTSDVCGFILGISNHNSAAKNIDEIQLEITSLNGAPEFIDIPVFPHWNANFTQLQANIVSDNGGIAPNNSLNGIIFAYTIGQTEPPIPVTINWTTKNAGSGLDSGQIYPVCTQYQSFTKLDTATVITSQSGVDPCFTFTMVNRNLQGVQTTDIYHVSFEIQNIIAGTMRPSKVTPANGWITDSVTTSTAYFHTDNNPIIAGGAIGGWSVCLRGNPAVNKFNFVWAAYEIGNSLIDRDTIFNISNTATGSPTEADSLSLKTVTGCLYNVTLKNFHLSNQQPPSRIVKLKLTSKTAGVGFVSAPTIPLHWSKTVTADSIVYLAPTLSDGIPDGIVSTNQFSFSDSGATSTNYNIGWETYKAGATFPSQVTLLSSGTVTTNCVVAAKTADIAINSVGLNECDYKLSVTNAHNIKPPSNLNTLTISIPASAGSLTGTSGPAGWNWGASGATITSKTASSSDNMITGKTEDFLYTFAPKTPGTNVTATWTTLDEQAQTTGTGTFTINCSPISNLCDTFVQTSVASQDSCVKIFTLTNRRSVSITHVEITASGGWEIDSSSIPSAGWTRQYVGTNQVNYDIAEGSMKAGDHADLTMKFIKFYPNTAPKPPAETFTVTSTSIDASNKSCSNAALATPACLPVPIDTSHLSVALHPNEIGVANFTIVPNPTRGSADISFDLKSHYFVEISVMDVLGNRIATLSHKSMTEGSYHIPYTMTGLPNGTYYIRMQTPFGVMTRKLVLTK